MEQVKNHVSPSADSISEREVQPESRILTFAELQHLIESGKVDQIPNNKIIPDKLNVGLPHGHCNVHPLIGFDRKVPPVNLKLLQEKNPGSRLQRNYRSQRAE